MGATATRLAAPRRYRRARSLTLWSAVACGLLTAALMGWGAYRRRWMSDDGLIVLRTVRNLMAGNGPVFNAGERVETNTSALWQYLIWAGAEVSGARLEHVATVLALVLTVAAVFVAAWATGTAAAARRDALLMVPAGLLVYTALPPARDFATSGLEWGLALFWLAGLWWLGVRWALSEGHATARTAGWTAALAFWAGLSWLVRPELALYGGLVGLLLLVTAGSWRRAGLVLACGLPVPAAYQVFRMGYYGLLTPHTAVAKSAVGSDWAGGWRYTVDFFGSYAFWIVAALLAAYWWARRGSDGGQATARTGWRDVRVLRVVLLVCAALHVVYVLRVGGDFMHGRMWLLPLFTAVMPVAVLPVTDLRARNHRADLAATAACVGLAGWAAVVAWAGSPWTMPGEGEGLGVVDERSFWTAALAHPDGRVPRTAEDFLVSPALEDFPEQVTAARARDDAQIVQVHLSDDPLRFSWITVPRSDGSDGTPADLTAAPPTLYMINLGMTGMNAPLDVRVLDTVGLADPLAARQPRLDNARVGHNKDLPLEWQLADGAADLRRLPDFADAAGTARAREALYTPQLRELAASYREPMSLHRFTANIRFALTGGRTLTVPPDAAEIVAPQPRHDAGRIAPDTSAGPVQWPPAARTAGDPAERGAGLPQVSRPVTYGR